MKIGAMVPARIGSKRLPRKNILDLGGKPLLCWTVDILLESEVFDTVTVSTESEEVADVVRGRYSRKDVRVLMRPEALAGDNSPLSAVTEHYLASNDYEYFGLFLPTFPFRRVARLRELAYAIHSRYPWRVQSFTNRLYSSMDYFYPGKNGVKRVFRLHPMHCPASVSTYSLSNRHCYGDKWLKTGISTTERRYMVMVDDLESLDIDTPADFARAQLVAGGKTPVLRPAVSTRFGDWLAVTPQGADPGAFMDFIGPGRTRDMTKPVLILGEANPPLNFYTIMSYSVRLHYIDRQANDCFLSKKVDETGNSSYIPTHYLHDQHYRVLRVQDIPAHNAERHWPGGCVNEQGFPHGMCETDCYGLYFGTEFGDEEMTLDQVVWREDLARQPFYVDPYAYV